MKPLEHMIRNVDLMRHLGDAGRGVSGIFQDSRSVIPDGLFVAVRGSRTDGHRYIAQAIEKGATVVVCEEIPSGLNPGITCLQVSNTSEALGILASEWYDHPSRKLRLVGVTGTNGKTTIATLLYRLFEQMGYKAGLVSTIQYMIHDFAVPATHTTPDALNLNRLLHEMVSAGVEYAFMEVSSHAMAQKRASGLKFAGGIFTNITRDHLDYHHGFDDYLRAKKSFFDSLPEGSFALVNADESHSRIMVQNTRATVKTYALKTMADYRCKIIEPGLDGMLLNIGGREMSTGFIGEFNASNLLAVYSASMENGLDQEETIRQLSTLGAVPGRFETLRTESGQRAVVDYAHTPDALENVLKTLNRLRRADNRIFTVVGAGGDRDKGKRPIMARIAASLSHQLILTSDNPRSEDPESILDDMEGGLQKEERKNVIRITDRREAIRAAVMMAGLEDIILVAGKGHETYQEVKGVRYPFDDREVLREFMR